MIRKIKRIHKMALGLVFYLTVLLLSGWAMDDERKQRHRNPTDSLTSNPQSLSVLRQKLNELKTNSRGTLSLDVPSAVRTPGRSRRNSIIIPSQPSSRAPSRVPSRMHSRQNSGNRQDITKPLTIEEWANKTKSEHLRNSLNNIITLKQELAVIKSQSSKTTPLNTPSAGRTPTEGRSRTGSATASSRASPQTRSHFHERHDSGNFVVRVPLPGQQKERRASPIQGKAPKGLLKIYQEGAQLGNMDDLNDMAILYLTGEEGVPKDPKEAFGLFLYASQKNHAVALFNVGQSVMEEKNPELACRYYEQAAAQGLIVAQYKLAVCYVEGQGVPLDYNRAAELLISVKNRLATHNSEPYIPSNAQEPLCTDYDIRSVRWSNNEVAQNLPTIFYHLGCAYRDGIETAVDQNMAQKYFEEAKALGLCAPPEEAEKGKVPDSE